jgi:hypothetical protein
VIHLEIARQFCPCAMPFEIGIEFHGA